MAQSMHVDERRNGAARSAVKARAADVLDDFEELRRDVRKLAGAAGKAARQEVKYTGKKIERMSRDLKTRARENVDLAGNTVREHPAAAIGASLGAGVLLGFLLSRR